MARTDKPQPTSAIPFPDRPKRSKSKPAYRRHYEDEEVTPSPKRPKKNSPKSTQASKVVQPAIVPCHTITERIMSNQLTIDPPISDYAEATIVNSIEYQTMVQWFIEKCHFTIPDANTFAFSLIAHHRVFNINTLYYLFIHDRNYLTQLLPVGYLISLERQLFNQFFKKLDHLTERELFILLRNSGFSKSTVELLIYTYEVCGVFLSSVTNLEQELLNLGLLPMVAKALVSKVQEWKICGVPVTSLSDSTLKPEEIEASSHKNDPQTHNNPLISNQAEFLMTSSSQPFQAEAKVEDSNLNLNNSLLEDCLDAIARDYSEMERQEGRNSAEEISESKLIELFDFEIMSNFDQEFPFADENVFSSDADMDKTDSCVGSSPIYHERNSELSTSPSNSCEMDISTSDRSLSSAKPNKKSSNSKRSSPQKQVSITFSSEEISRNCSFLKIPALAEPSVCFFETLFRRNKKEAVNDMAKHRILVELVSVVSNKSQDTKLRRRAFQLINGCVRLADNQQVAKLVPMDAFLTLTHSALKVDDTSIIHQALLFIESILSREPPFLPSALCLLLKILNAKKERILRNKQIFPLAKIVEIAIKVYNMELEMLIEMVELINFLLLSMDPSTQYSLLQSCTMILEENEEHLIHYFLGQFSWKRFSTLLSSTVEVVKTEAMVICETITCERLEPVKVLLQECPGLLSIVRELLVRDTETGERESLQSLAFGFVGNICSGDVEDIQKLIDEDIFTILCGYFLSNNNKLYEKSEINLRNCKKAGKHSRSNKRKRNYKHLEIREKIHLQCAFAICYTLFGGSEEQILYLINKHQLFTILLAIISNYSNTLDLMEEFIPALNRVLTMDIKDPKQASEFLYLLRNNYFIEILSVKEAFVEENMDLRAMEEILAIVRGQ